MRLNSILPCMGLVCVSALAFANGGNGDQLFSLLKNRADKAPTSFQTFTYLPTVTAALGVTATATNSPCYNQPNGALNITATGWAPNPGPMTFAYSGMTYAMVPVSGSAVESPVTDGLHSFPGLRAGTYNVTVTDGNGNTATAGPIIIQQPPAPNIPTALPTPTLCSTGNTGKITLTQSFQNPTGPYQTASAVSSVTFRLTSGPGTPLGPVSVSNPGPYTTMFTGLAPGTYAATVQINGCSISTISGIVISAPPAVTASVLGTTAVLCFGNSNGKIRIQAGGGTSPYTFDRGTGAVPGNNAAGLGTHEFTGLAAGSYTVTVTDANGCSATTTATVGTPGPLVAGSPSSTLVSCFGGSNGTATFSVTGGTLGGGVGYTFNIGVGSPQTDNTSPYQQTFSGLLAGSYTCTITDANGCSTTSTTTVGTPTMISPTSTSVNVLCFGGNNGSIDLSVSGGTPGYTYLWSNGATTQDISSLTAATYTVTVTDANGCTKTHSKTITQPTAVATTAVPTAVSCFGGSNGSIALTPSGGTPGYTYLWSNGATTQNISGLTAGTYSVTVTDANSCTKTTSATVTQPTALSATAVPTAVSCFGGSDGSIDLSPTGGSPAYTYLWSNGATTQDVSGLGAGNYSVTTTDSHGCSLITGPINVAQPSQLNFVSAVGTNPLCNGNSNGSIALTVNGGTLDYKYNIGAGYVAFPSGSGSATIPNLAAGTYTITISDAHNCASSPTTRTVTLTNPPVLSITLSTLTMPNVYNALCDGSSDGAFYFEIAGGSPFDPMGTPYYGAELLREGVFVASGLLPPSPPDSYAFGLDSALWTVTITDLNGCMASLSQLISDPDPVVGINEDVTNVDCNGNTTGEIYIEGDGGTGDYLFTINPDPNGASTVFPNYDFFADFTNLPAGTYTITITDENGCTNPDPISFTITEPDPLVVSTSNIGNPLCYGDNGSVTVTTTGGTVGPNTYYEVDGFDYLGNSVSISQLNDPVFYLPADNGSGYVATVQDDNFCIASSSTFYITQPSELLIDFVTIDFPLCYGDFNGEVDVFDNNGGTHFPGPHPYAYYIVGTDVYGNQIVPVFNNTGHFTNLSNGSYTVVITDAHGCTDDYSFNINLPDPITLNLYPTDASCYQGSDGAIDLVVSGGTPYDSPGNGFGEDYDFNWENSNGDVEGVHEDLAGLTADTYSVTVTDANGCIATANATVGQPDPWSVYGEPTPAYCSGPDGSIDVFINESGDNVGDYYVELDDNTQSYLDSQDNLLPDGNGQLTSFTGLPAGTYYIYVYDNGSPYGCSIFSEEIVVTAPNAPLALTETHENEPCFGNALGTINLSVSGGEAPYSYLWSNGATTEDLAGLTAGTYNVTVTDVHGCTKTGSVTITEPDELLAAVDDFTHVSCHGYCNGDIDIDISGGTAPYSYLWNNGATTEDIADLCAGTYCLTATDANGCTDEVCFTITEPSEIDATFTLTEPTCHGDSDGSIVSNISGGTPPYYLDWDNSGDNNPDTGISDPDPTGLEAGNYTVVVTDGNYCQATFTVTLGEPAQLFAYLDSYKDLTCHDTNDGEIHGSASGGTAPYFFFLGGLEDDGDIYTAGPQMFADFTGLEGSSVLNGGSGYTLGVTDSHGCYADYEDIQIINPDVLDANGSTPMFSCQGGEVLVQPIGGTGPYWIVPVDCNTHAAIGDTVFNVVENYIFTELYDPLGPPDQMFCFEVHDANDCGVAYASATIHAGDVQPDVILNIDNVTNTNCYGSSDGSITASATGGSDSKFCFYLIDKFGNPSPTTCDDTAPFQVTFSGLEAGDYDVVVTDMMLGCSVTIYNVTISEPTPIGGYFDYSDVNCAGGSDGSITFFVCGGTPDYSVVLSGPVAGTLTVVGGTCTGELYGFAGDFDPSNWVENYVNSNNAVDDSNAPNEIVMISGDDGSGDSGYADYTTTVPMGISSISFSWDFESFDPPAMYDAFGYLLNGVYHQLVVGNDGSPQFGNEFINVAPGDVFGFRSNTLDNISAPSYTTISNFIAFPDAFPVVEFDNLSAGHYDVVVTDANGCNAGFSVDIAEPTPFDASEDLGAHHDVSCFNGSDGAFQIVPSGGDSPYFYEIDNGASINQFGFAHNLAAGIYTVTATDAHGCIDVVVVEITEPDELVVTGLLNDISCFGNQDGSIELSVTGGTPNGFGNYHYFWTLPDNSILDYFDGSLSVLSGLAAGTYTVTVYDDHDCSATTTPFIITEPSVLEASADVTNVNCFGGSDGSITVNPIGGTAPYQYSIDNGVNYQPSNVFSGLPAGTYTIDVEDDHECAITLAGIVVGQPASALAATATAVVPVLNCNGQTTNISTSVSGGTAPYSYLWNNGQTTDGLTAVVAGTYSVTVTDSHSCTKVASVTITQPAPIVAIGTPTNPFCYGGNGSIALSITGGTPPYSNYLWSNGANTPNLNAAPAGTYTVTFTDSHGCSGSTTATITQPTQIVLNISGTNISCNGGSNGTATVSATGGTGNPNTYTFVWSNGGNTASISNLQAGTYTVTVYDANGCPKTAQITLTQPTQLLVSTTVVNGTCSQSGSITANPSGGTPTYSYAWSNGATTASISPASGTYIVTVTDANGCTKTASATIINANSISITATPTNPFCNGGVGSIQTNVTGGTPNFQYLWSNGAQTPNLNIAQAGTYTVTVTDFNGCTATASATITAPPAIVLNASSTNVTCFGLANGTATVAPTGGTGNSYFIQWSTGSNSNQITNLPAGTYGVTVTDVNGCSKTGSVVVSQPSMISLSTTVVNGTCSEQGSITVNATGGTPSYTYLWSNGATTATISNIPAGNYSVVVTDANGCTKSTSATLNQPVGLTVTAVPTNPFCFGGTGSIQTNVQGGTPNFMYLWSNGSQLPNLTNVQPGTYTVTVTDFNQCTGTATATLVAPSMISFTLTPTQIQCFGMQNGSIALTNATGGTPFQPNSTYNYLWSNGATTASISNLAPGTYTVTVTDANNCTKTGSATITQPTQLLVAFQYPPITCFGGTTTVTISASGGVGPYQGVGDFANQAAGPHTFSVTDANGCTSAVTFTITQPTQLMVGATNTPILCNGGSSTVTVSATGGTAPYSGTGTFTQPAGTQTYVVTDANGCSASTTVTISQPTAVVASASATPILCNGGTSTVTVTAQGGTPGYQGTGVFQNQLAGPHTYTVTDANGCTATATITISQPNALILDENHVNVLCNGGSNGAINLFVNGGTPAYSYLWSNGSTTQNLSNLTAGSYSVTVTDANGCTKTLTTTITQPALLVLSETHINVACMGGNGGSIDLSANGGTGSYSYIWSNGATTQDINGLTAGTYSVTTTDVNQCSKTLTVGITEPTMLLLTETHTTTPCGGGNGASIDLTVVGGTPNYTYLWSNGATTQDLTNLASGTYTVTVTDANQCTKSLSITISQPTMMILDENHANVSCNGGSNGSINLFVNGGTPAYSYLWSNGATTQNLAGLTAGSYSVTVTDANGCTKTLSQIVISQPAAILLTETHVNVLCNGALTGSIDLTATGGTGNLSYFWSNQATTQDLSGLAAGSYTVVVVDANQCSKTLTIVITQPTMLLLTETHANAICGMPNGSIDLTVGGGTPAYSYLWSNGATTQDLANLSGGTYSVTVTDANQCTKTLSVVIQQSSMMILDENHANVSCNGGSNGSINLFVNGGTPAYSYLWSNGATPQDLSNIAAGTYIVTVTDANGCTSTKSTTVTQPTQLTATVTGGTAGCSGNGLGCITTAPIGGTPAYQIQVSGQNGGGAGSISQMGGSLQICNLPVGTYTVLVTDANGCTFSTTASVTQGATVVLTTAVTNVSCNGGSNGSIDLSTNGGLPNFTYLWSNGATTQDISNLAAGTFTVTVTDASGCTATTSATVTQPTAISIVKTIVNVGCNGGSNGSISTQVSGGTPGYTYVWNNQATTSSLQNLTAGTYSVTVTDANGCSKVMDAVVTQPTAISIVKTIVNVSCNGGSNGSISTQVSGGTPGYTYVWNNQATTSSLQNLTAGTYSVTVTDANGCSKVMDAVVTQPTTIALSTQVTNAGCGGNGSISLTATGGTPTYTFLWSNGATTQNLPSVGGGTYTVTVTDANGCTKTTSATVQQSGNGLTVTATATNALCFGGNGSVSSSVSGGMAPFSYLWSNGSTIQNLASVPAGTYSVTVTASGGCTGTATATVTAPTQISIQVSVTHVLCNGQSNGSITLTASGGTPNYQFKLGNGAYGNNNVFGSLAAGTYVLVVRDANGCERSVQATVLQPLILSANAAVSNVSCGGGSDGKILINATGGSPNYEYKLNAGNYQPSNQFTGLAAGNYTVTVRDANGCTTSLSVTITQPQSGPLAIKLDQIVPVACFGGGDGAIYISLTGCGPFTISWYNGNNLVATTEDLVGVPAGTYSVFVQDGNGMTVSLTNLVITTNTTTIDNLIVENNNTCSVKLSWDAKPNVDGYEVRFRPCGALTWTTFALGPNVTMYTFTGLSPNTCYDFSVRFSSEICFGAWTNVNGLTTATYDPPVNTNAVVNSNSSATIVWGQSSCSNIPVNNVELRYKKASAATWTVVTLPGTALSYTLNGLMPNTTYQYRLRNKYIISGVTKWSNFTPTKTFTTPVNLKPTDGSDRSDFNEAIRIDYNIGENEDIRFDGENATPSLAFTLAPNPTTDRVWLRFSEFDAANSLTIRLLSVEGREISRQTILDSSSLQFDETVLDVSQLPQGFYLIEVVNGDHREVEKLIKQ